MSITAKLKRRRHAPPRSRTSGACGSPGSSRWSPVLTVVAVPAQIYADTGSSAYVGLTGVFGLVPLIVFGLYGGAPG